MLINMKMDITLSGVKKTQKHPGEGFYKRLENLVKTALIADSVEIVDIDMYDETDEEMDIDWD